MSETFVTGEWRGVDGKLKAITCGAPICDNAVEEATREGERLGLERALKLLKRVSHNARGINVLRNDLKAEVEKVRLR